MRRWKFFRRGRRWARGEGVAAKRVEAADAVVAAGDDDGAARGAPSGAGDGGEAFAGGEAEGRGGERERGGGGRIHFLFAASRDLQNFGQLVWKEFFHRAFQGTRQNP